MKKLLIGIAGVVVLLGGAAVVLPSMIDWSAYKAPLIDRIERESGYKVAVNGDIRARVLPFPAVELNDIQVSFPQENGKLSSVFKAQTISGSLALFPLLTGRVEVGEVSFIAPDIHVKVLAGGKIDMPATLAAKMGGGKEPSDTAAAQGPETGDSAALAERIGLSGVSIKKGKLTLVMDETGAVHTIENLDASLGLRSLLGPYRLAGSGVYNGHPFEIKAKTNAILDAAADVDTVFELKLPEQQARASFEGTLSRRAGGDAQGTLSVHVNRPADLARSLAGLNVPVVNEPLSLKTLLSATPRNIVLDRIDLTQGKTKIEGTIKTRLADLDFPRPMVQARLNSAGTIDLRALLQSAGPKKSKDQDKKAGADKKQEMGAVAKSAPFDLDLEWKAGGILLGPDPLRDVAMTLTVDKGAMRGRVQAGKLPGNGALDLTLYPGSNGWVIAQGALNLNDPGQFIARGLGVTPPSPLADGRIRDLKVKSEIQMNQNDGNVQAESGVLSWRGGEVSFGGSSYDPRSGKRPLLTLVLGGRQINLDSLSGNVEPEKAAPGDGKNAGAAIKPGDIKIAEKIKSALSSVSLPFDLDSNISFGTVRAGGYAFSEVESALKIRDRKIQLDSLKIGSFEGAAIEASGTIADSRAVSGVDLRVSALASDGKAALQKIAPDQAAKWPGVSPLRVNLAYKGDLGQADVNLKAEAFGVGIAMAGPVASPLAAPKMDQMQVSISADRAGNVVRLIQPAFKMTPPLQAPVKMTGAVTIKDKIYGIRNVEGQFGPSSVKGEVTVDLSGARPKISGGLNLGEVPLDAWIGVDRAAGAGSSSQPGSAAGGGGDRSGPWSNAPIQTAWMRAFDADFSVAADKVVYNLWTLSKAALAANLSGGRLDVRDLRAGLFGGQIAGSAQLAARSDNAPLEVKAELTMADVNARSLTNALLGRVMNRMDGVVGLSLNVTAAGTSPARIVTGLNGSAESNGKDVTLNGIDVARLVSWLTTDLKPSTTLAGLSDSFMGTGATTFETHEGKYTIESGLVRLDSMVFDGTQARLDTAGRIDLPAWRVDTKTTIKVKNPPKVPELSFTLKGPLDRPAQNMLGGLFENYLQQQLGKQVNKVIEKKFGNKLNDLGLGGLLGGGVAAPEPAPVEPVPPVDGTVEQPPVTPEPVSPAPEAAPVPAPAREVKPEDVLIDVLKGLSR